MTTSLPAGAIVVGIDGSTWSDLALDWAAQEASLEGRPLVLLHAVYSPSAGAMTFLESASVQYGELLGQLRRDAEDLLDKAAQRVHADHDLADVHQVVRLTDPREALLDAAVNASMLVVGTRGLGPIRQLLLGSVSAAMTKHAGCPVVVMRPGRQRSRQAGVLVGVAGDERDDAVVDFAFRIAETRRLAVTLVHSFWDVVAAEDESREVPADEPGCEDQRAVLTEAADRPSGLHPSVPVHLLLSRGFADVQLIQASRNAELLVLGHSRKPFLQEFIYGSVAPRVVEHAHCAVAVVPVGQEAGESDPATV